METFGLFQPQKWKAGELLGFANKIVSIHRIIVLSAKKSIFESLESSTSMT